MCGGIAKRPSPSYVRTAVVMTIRSNVASEYSAKVVVRPLTTRAPT